MSRFGALPWPLRAAGLATLAGAALAAWTTLTLLVALAGQRRLAGGFDLGPALLWAWASLDDPDARRWLAIGALAAGLALLVLALEVARNLQRPLHGAARWAGEADLRRAGLRSPTGLVLGNALGRPLVFGGGEHAVIYAPTRSGKGVGVVIPNLLTWPDSVVVLDVKRENWEATAGHRAAHGHAVHLFDPLDPEGRTARYNPLGHIDRHDPVAVLDELQRIAVMLLPTPPSADPFWAESARTGFIGVGAYLAETPDLPFTLGALYGELVRDDPRTRFPRLIAERAKAGRPLSTGCVRALQDFCGASDNTFASVRQTLTSRLNLWLNPRVCAATAASDFDLSALRDRRTALYLATSPDNLLRVAPLFNLLFQQLVDLSCRERPQAGRHPHQVLVLLDEFARLGHATVIAKGFAYVAGYGLRLLPVLQSPAQLRGEYGPDLAEDILANCAVEIAFATKELKLAQALSERLGATTVRARSRSRPAGLSTGRRSVSESDQRRPLMLPQEIMQLPPDRLIVLKAGAPPVLGRKLAYWRDRALRTRVRPPPEVPPCRPAPAGAAPPPDPAPTAALEALLAAEGLEPMPPEGASVEELEAWVERVVDRSVAPPAPEEPAHGR